MNHKLVIRNTVNVECFEEPALALCGKQSRENPQYNLFRPWYSGI